MTKRNQRPPHYWLHRILARPFHIIWIVGTIGLWVPLSLHLSKAGVFGALTAEGSIIPMQILSCAAISGLGFYAALFTISWPIFAVSRRMNGAPYEVGEIVTILFGPFSGRVSSIYQISPGQDGQPLPRIDLGEEAGQKYLDLFEEYALLRMSLRSSPTLLSPTRE